MPGQDLVESGRLTQEEFERASRMGAEAYGGDFKLKDNPHSGTDAPKESALCAAWDQGYVEALTGRG